MFSIKKLITLTFSIFAATVFASDRPQISQQSLISALEQPDHNIVVLDVRSAQEYNDGHLASAINVSHNTIADKMSELTQYKNNTVVVYCRSGYRAGIAENILNKNGFTDVLHLEGDMNGWLEAGLPVIKNN